MAISIAIKAMGGRLLAQSLNIRTRANEKVDSLADAQRALNIISREIAEAGFNHTDNGIDPADSITDANGNSTIRIRSNLNKFNTAGNPWYAGGGVSSGAQNGISLANEDAGEDVKYFVYDAGNTNLLARYDVYGGGSTVLANRLDSLHIHYFDQKATHSTAACDIPAPSVTELTDLRLAKDLVIAVRVN